MLRFGRTIAVSLWVLGGLHALPQTGTVISNPYQGVTYIRRAETSTRGLPLVIHILQIDLTAPGISFKLSPAAPHKGYETTTQSTLDYMNRENAQAAVNVGFFLPANSGSYTPYPTNLIGLVASNGNVYSGFEIPAQSYAIVAGAPGINIDRDNLACIVHSNDLTPTPHDVVENVVLWNAFAGSAQIVTDGEKTIPCYKDDMLPDCQLTPGSGYGNDNSWYQAYRARTAAGLSKDNRMLFFFTVDEAGGSTGMRVEDVADVLIRDYHVHNALNLDGGGSTTMALRNPVTGVGSVVNTPNNNPSPRLVGCSLAIFARK